MLKRKNIRIKTLIAVFLFVFSAVIGRSAYVALSREYTVSDSYNSYTLTIDKKFTTIYDRNGEPLNNNSKSLVAVIRPNEKDLAELDKLFTSSEIKEITSELSSGFPIVREISNYAKTDSILVLEKIGSSNIICEHLIAEKYSGLESVVSEEVGELKVNFQTDAFGRVLNGDSGTVIDDNYYTGSGVITSIDSRVQEIAEKAAKSIDRGAVVILDTDTSQILASVSRGDDYLNHAASNFAVGSVFKLVVAACAIENGITPIYNCTSSITVGDTVFNCSNQTPHGLQNMKQALANSCNCYFVNLALKLGKDKLYNTAKDFGFGDDFYIFSDFLVSSGIMPSVSELSSDGQLSLLGFGQGRLTDSPLHFASVVASIANGGNYSFPTLYTAKSTSHRVMSEHTAQTLREYMHFVVTDGTGINANYNNKTAGKTATAQTGIYSNGKELLNAWFAGFYPVDNPKYAIVVMCENATSGAVNCCPVFRTVVEMLEKL